MTHILFRPADRFTTTTVMETIMKPLSLAKRSARWLATAGIALALLAPAGSAKALEITDLTVIPDGVLDTLVEGIEPIEPVDPLVEFFFEKTGGQVSCDYVNYTLRYGLRGKPAFLALPAFEAVLAGYSMDFSDQFPAGLSIVDVQVEGDATGAGGGAIPASVISTMATPNDTVTITDFRLTTADIDASGELGERYMTVRITAEIDDAAFPAPVLVDNQGRVKINVGPGAEAFSHDPALPDDGDFLTGEKTAIMIDVTDCDPPPPPPPGDEEPCFEVVTGEVDCVPGGGAFIYSMPFGADMGGKVIQLKTTTPGITIAPPSQFVPAGGGVLNWTITGALPGDVIHLIVVGVETYAGPAEGVGLCCTQTIDLVIPADLDCSDEEKEPDLEVLKKADVAFCTKEGGCDFTITVTNVGDAPYNGPIVLEEVTAPGNGTVTSGPNVPWGCLPMVSPMLCTHPATTLNPGESVELKLGFTPGPAWDWPVIRNCAEYDYTASGFAEPFGDTTNDKSCASIPICIPGVHAECTPPEEEPKVDLTIRKIATPVMCTEDRVCHWQIMIMNPTTETFNGPLTLIDEFPIHAPASVNIEPTGPWACAPESASRFRCDHPGLMLVGGAFTLLTVEAVIGDDHPGNEVENCGEIVPFPDELDTTNNTSCATAMLPEPEDDGEPQMRITKTCDAAVAGGAVSCRITVISVGTAAPSGPVRVNDAAELVGAGAPVAIQTVSPDGPEWSCGPVPADTLACEIPGAVMTPGTARHFDVTLSVSPNETFENCARGSYGPAPGDDVVRPIGEACDQGGATLSIKKTGDAQCEPGQECSFAITVTNESDSDFSGQVRFGDAMSVEGLGRLEGVPIISIEPPFGCAEEPATLPLSCLADLTLGAGESRTHTVTVMIPDDGRFDALDGPAGGQNCVAVLSPDTPVLGGGGGGVSRREITIDPSGLGDAYSCHSFALSKQEQQSQECSAGFVLNADGRCVCPEGTTFRNRTCAGEPTPQPEPDPTPETQSCTLLPGQIRTKAGECICPRGTELRRGACRKIVVEEPPVRQCKLLPGQIRTADGRCICPRGTELRRNACRKVDDTPPVRQCTLLPGQIRTKAGECVCPRGTKLERGACRKIEQPPVRECKLLPGQVRTKDGKCVCPRGTELKNRRCVKVDQPGIRIPGIKIVPEIQLPRRDPNQGRTSPNSTAPRTNTLKVRPGTTSQ
ncbi:MAG TPA: hypothetical protein VMF90_14320 [Rhizobiaceae bacterium]|nr:hypothetical protein [Rhizobiaceae bacterium]